MTAFPCSNGFCPPSQAQLALALAIVKSKPAHVSIKDFILGVRNHVKSGRRKQVEAVQDDRHLDSAAFWREAYEKSEAAQSRLLDKIYELEQRNEAAALKANPETGKESTLTKRKANSGTASLALRPLKRSKTTSDAKLNSRKTDLILNFPGLTKGVSCVESATTPFLRRFHALQKLLQKKPQPELLATACAELCSTVEQLINVAITPKRTRATNLNKSTALPSEHPRLTQVLIAFETCYPFLLQALRKLSGTDQGESQTGLITYHLVRLFQRILSQLHQHALLKAKNSFNQRKALSKRAKKAARTKTADPKGQQSVQLSREDNRIMDSICQVLAKMIISIDFSKDEQNALLEGFLFVLLEHVGKILGSLVFKELRSDPELRICHSKVRLPGALAQSTASRVDASIAEHAAKLQSRHLVWVFEQALASLNDRTELQKKGKRYLNTTTAPLSDFLSRAKKKLQNTLLKGVFGEDDPKFKESLQLPCEISQSQAMNLPIDKNGDFDQNSGDWFVQEVWRLLGWDVLMENEEHSLPSSPQL
ncbi:hypothetical protein PRK78_006552 [Emydomyces testavorans]|uniref:Uncharacterized protein n=1 Tax=Emydomyces testavorans TaxID=2070801 RepID=A0AAF0IKX6_9EURO|nr:hypothetical protein PRK78_006552 [Emydomyces testavorans]